MPDAAMSAVVEAFPAGSPRLRDIALAAVADTVSARDENQSVAAARLTQVSAEVRQGGRTFDDVLHLALRRPARRDVRLVSLAVELQLSRLELLTVALAAAVDDDPLLGRVLAHMQAPIGGSRPTLGLLGHTFGRMLDDDTALLPMLLNGGAVRSGLLTVLGETAPLPERPVMVPTPVCLAFSGFESEWPGTTTGLNEATRIPLTDSIVEDAERQSAILTSEPGRTLLIRSGSSAECRSVALEIATAVGCQPVFIDTDKLAGLGPWLLLRRLMPVFSCELAPGERRRLPQIAGYRGPVLAVCGPDGFVEAAHGAAADWVLPIPSAAARRTLWLSALGGQRALALAERLAAAHRHGAGRIAQLGRVARHHATLAGRSTPEQDDVIAASWSSEGSGLEALAQPLRARVSDDALVATPALRSDLEELIQRCRLREDLVEALGPSARTRYQPGVRALFTGPSGTGKTLAASWIATRLGLPLYRVDLASITSKYIGETEKNLSQLLCRAEQAELILLFDEADSLFGKRTDISDANDRFANAQTNYLLQRIESYDGIVLLTSNSQARFDDAFARRLDFIVDFPTPGPDERRALWRAHLGASAVLTPAQLNRLSVLLDLNGGQIRNAVLAAAVRSRAAARPIEFGDVLAGAHAELRKLGRQVPLELGAGV